MGKKILYVLSAPPYQGVRAQESLDVVMTLGAFDQEVSLLLLDDGVYQVKSGQQVTQLSSKILSAYFQALPIYDVNPIFIEAESLTERGLTLADMSVEVAPLARRDLSGLYKQYDLILCD